MTHLKESFSQQFPIPFSKFAPNQSAEMVWANERMTSGYPTFEYKINEYGLRFDTDEKEEAICFAGCSHTFAQGVDQYKGFAEIVAKEKNAQCINVGMPAAGPDVQMLNLTWAVEKFKNIKSIVWYMSQPLRQIVYDGYIHTFVPPRIDFFENRKLAKQFLNVNFTLDQTIATKTYWNVYTFLNLMKARNINVYMHCWDDKFNYQLQPLIKEYCIEIGDMNNIDKARDEAHNGIKSHQDFAERILETMNEI